MSSQDPGWYNLSGPVEDQPEHDDPVKLAQAVGEWLDAHPRGWPDAYGEREREREAGG